MTVVFHAKDSASVTVVPDMNFCQTFSTLLMSVSLSFLVSSHSFHCIFSPSLFSNHVSHILPSSFPPFCSLLYFFTIVITLPPCLCCLHVSLCPCDAGPSDQDAQEEGEKPVVPWRGSDPGASDLTSLNPVNDENSSKWNNSRLMRRVFCCLFRLLCFLLVPLLNVFVVNGAVSFLFSR